MKAKKTIEPPVVAVEVEDTSPEPSITIAQKKELAHLIYMSDTKITQKEVAEKVGVTEKTLSKWVTGDNWDKRRKSILITKQTVLAGLYDQLEEMNTNIQGKPEGQRYMNNKDADIYLKITATIKNLETETSLAQHIECAKQFLDFLRKVDLTKAKEFAQLFDGFIKHLL